MKLNVTVGSVASGALTSFHSSTIMIAPAGSVSVFRSDAELSRVAFSSDAIVAPAALGKAERSRCYERARSTAKVLIRLFTILRKASPSSSEPAFRSTLSLPIVEPGNISMALLYWRQHG